jgi:glyoxylase I family protein
MINAVHHLGLTVTNVDASTAWYERVLGFRRDGEFETADGERRKVFLRSEGLSVRIGPTEHRCGNQDPFDETRVGLDRLAFGVADRGDLDSLAHRLDELGVTRSLIASANSIAGASVLVFRDPDNIQLEFLLRAARREQSVAVGVADDRR